jgi:hypothetical protein
MIQGTMENDDDEENEMSLPSLTRFNSEVFCGNIPSK